MTALVTASDVREHVETDLSDTALDRLIADADAEIVRSFGAHTGTVTERFTPGPSDERIWTARPIASITSITETYVNASGESPVTLAVTDYEVEGDREIRRTAGGTNSSSEWRGIVTVVYTPSATTETARRKRVTIDLVRLACRYEGASASKAGDFSVNHVDYERERSRLLRRLSKPLTGFIA